MEQYKNILLGINTYHVDWLYSIKRINKKNIIIANFEDIITVDENIDYIIPLSEKDYNIIKNKVKDTDKVLYPSIETFNLLHNKVLFTKFMLENFKDMIPTTYYLDNMKLLDIEFPVIYKPMYSTNGIDMKIYHNHTQFVNCKKKVIIQKFIEDEYEYSAYILCVNGEILTWKVIRDKFEKHTIKKTNYTMGYENLKNFEIKLFEPLIKKLNYMGAMNVNFKFNEDTKQLYIFEINPRFGGSAFTNDFIYELICI